ncbi:sugar porter family MFS transporter [Aureibaculum algae]|uniref:Sugar porter family MFS transporter n=1 Tax=Aureibaculum algae TaxID=2584122 RepID=A0A5B7TLL9_9FLAO|nr:MFS transporter [Aureibaculum algae]QCX37609.1 sugar porter family MFS transporter [Aureibaculum algae]
MSSFKRNAFTYSTIVAMGGFVFGLDAALISGAFKFITAEFNLNPWQVGALGFGPGIGVLVALPLAAWSSNKYGRKATLKIIAAMYLISALGSAFAPSFATLFAARFLGGLAFSSITLAAMYIGEIAPAEWRGKLVSMTQINIVIGLTAAYFINYWLLQTTNSNAEWVTTWGLREHTWRWMLGIEIIPALIWFGLLYLVPRSPAWLVYKGKYNEAKLTLAKVIPNSEIEAHVAEMKESVENSNQDRSVGTQLKEIFGKKMRIVAIVAFTMAIVQQSTGINAVLTYAPTVMEQLGLGQNAAFEQAIWIGLVSVIFTILSLVLIDKMGRRPMMIWGLVWVILSLGVCAYGFGTAKYEVTNEAIAEMHDIQDVNKLTKLVGKQFATDIEFKEAVKSVMGEISARDNSSVFLQKSAVLNATLILIGILSFIAAFHFSVGPIMWVLLSEIFPITLRGIAIPFFALLSSTISALTQFFFPWQLANMGASTIFLFYGGLVFIGLAILFKYLPETKNLTIEEIQAKLQVKSKV